jgi:hydroxyisourate hydrolase
MDGFNRLPPADAETALLSCCAAPAFALAVAGGRPYPDRVALLAAADAALRALTWTDVAEALAAHPRIGERPAGADREAAWSRREQSGIDAGDELVAANRAYEDRFGHVFLIFATGKDREQVLSAARARLGNDEQTERAVVAEELRRIALLRLERLVPMSAPISTHVLDLERGEPARGVVVRLERGTGDGWAVAAQGRTDTDGRLRDWVDADAWGAGDFRLVFAAEPYLGPPAFFPEIVIGFRVVDPGDHHHVPLLLNRHGYTTYRGS